MGPGRLITALIPTVLKCVANKAFIGTEWDGLGGQNAKHESISVKIKILAILSDA